MRTVALLLILCANVLGGVSYVWQDLAMGDPTQPNERGLPPCTITLIRQLVALVCVGAVLAARNELRVSYPRPVLLRLCAIGVFAFGLPLTLGIVGVRLSTPGNASVLILLEPVAIVALSFLLLREQVRKLQWLGITLGLLGALVIVGDGASWGDFFAGRYVTGNLILAIHGVLWGLYTPLMKPIAAGYSPFQLTFVTMSASLLLIVPAALWESSEWQGGDYLLPSLFWCVVLGVGVSFLATVFWNASLRWLRAFTVGAFVFVQPLTGLVADYAIGGRALSPQGWVGSVAIMVGVAAVLFPKRRRVIVDSRES